MAFTDFSLEDIESRFGILTEPGDLFPDLVALPVPAWLTEQLTRGAEIAAMVSEKARSEFIVTPILLTCRELVSGPLTIYSGQRLDVDSARGLTGECDFILARTSTAPRLRAPLVTILEAKRGDIEAGLGQGVAQMLAARLFNERAGTGDRAIFGIVTTGDDWQFMQLMQNNVILHVRKLFVRELGLILAALQRTLTL